MEIRTFWIITLKLFGLWIFLNLFYIIPQFSSTYTTYYGNVDFNSLLIIWGAMLAVMAVLIIFIRLFLFKTSWFVDKLKLDENFSEKRIDLNIKKETTLSIAIILLGGITFVDSLPTFCEQFFEFLQQKTLFKEYKDSHWLVYNFVKTVIAFIVMTNSKSIVKYIDKESAN